MDHKIEVEIGSEVVKEDLINIFEASEGAINMYYGLIGNGKTYAATSDILDLLKQGKVVYANWHINVEDFDDRRNLFMSLRNLLFFRKRHYKIPLQKNLHYFDPDKAEKCKACGKYHTANTTGELTQWLSELNDCHIFFDEGQDMFDSYEGTKFAKSKRRLILHTRHYHRTLNIISQRPTAIQVSARGNVNRFYKCVKIGMIFGRPRFARYEFQEMTGETVDENKEPISVKTYWGSKKVFGAYNTDYLAEGIPKSQSVFFEAYDLNFKERMLNMAYNLKLKRRELIDDPNAWAHLVPRMRCYPNAVSLPALYKWDPALVTKLKVQRETELSTV